MQDDFDVAMKAAYEILGYPTYHWVSMMENPKDLDLWTSALTRKYDDDDYNNSYTLAEWDALLGHVSAVTDSPINAFAPELIAAYPHAKVVLVERDTESWYKSFEKNVVSSFAAPVTRLVVKVEPGFIGKMGRIGDLLMRGQWDSKGFDEWRVEARDGYEEHNALVTKLVPKERLLLYKLGSGWEPLCQFLGRDIPDVEFPHVNETEELQERVFLSLMLGLQRACTRLTPWLMLFVAVALGLWKYLG
ncbi:hypothetical protein D6D26_10146 [Aureobasidium pullulans]|nr:hypothetical protein D6D26_10146 [Aureobasidium pullulans]